MVSFSTPIEALPATANPLSAEGSASPASDALSWNRLGSETPSNGSSGDCSSSSSGSPTPSSLPEPEPEPEPEPLEPPLPLPATETLATVPPVVADSETLPAFSVEANCGAACELDGSVPMNAAVVRSRSSTDAETPMPLAAFCPTTIAPATPTFSPPVAAVIRQVTACRSDPRRTCRCRAAPPRSCCSAGSPARCREKARLDPWPPLKAPDCAIAMRVTTSLAASVSPPGA